MWARRPESSPPLNTVTPTTATPYRGRFAPSPTGPLHLGSLLAALGSWLMARRAGGEWLLRIEDLDPPRERRGMARQHIHDLAGFGFEPDGPIEFQSRRGDHYTAALGQLRESGAAFECLCSRSDLATMAGVHRACVAHPSGTRPAWRVRLPPGTVRFQDRLRGEQAQDPGLETGDPVVLRADGLWAYQLAVVVDDAAQGITEVVRGADLLDSTARQIALQRLLGLPTPGYAHLPVVREASGAKLSKRLGSLPVDAADPLPALRVAYELLGQDPSVLTGAMAPARALDRALAGFDPTRIPGGDRLLAVE
jgi:glutamyl-Q tRNA(Asp) synthetase